MKYLDILPINYIDYLTYSLPKDKEQIIIPGQKVIIPFGNKKIEGIFIKYSKKPFFKTKPVLSITKNFVITNSQADILQYLSDHYFCSPAKALKLMNKCQEPENKEEKETKKENKFIILTKNTEDLYKRILEKNNNKEGQLLFVFPDIKNINEFIKLNKKAISSYKYVIFTSTIKDKEKELISKKVNLKEIDLIIGTRTSLFLPYNKLKTIVIDHGGEDGHFSEETPRYNSIEIAEKIIENKNINLIIQNETINEYLYIRSTQDYRIIKEKDNSSPKITIVKEPLYPAIGNILEKNIKNALGKNKKVAIFLNNKGENNILMCKDCKEILSCKTCGNKLLTNNKKIYCKQCNKELENIPKCIKCGGINIFSPGLTIKKTISEIKKIFPEEIIVELSKNNNKNIDTKDYDIIIGTTSLKNIDFNNIESLIILYPENIINIPGYNSESKALYTLSSIKEKLNQNKNLYIKTFLDEESVIKSLISGKYFYFYEEKAKELKNYGYPPFKDIIGVEIKDKNNNKLFNSEKKIKDYFNKYELMSEYEFKDKEYYKKKLFFRTMKNEIIYDTILKSLKNITIERNPKKGI